MGGLKLTIHDLLDANSGMITAFWGILCALMQHDLKCLLAYSSIENVGLILIGNKLGPPESINQLTRYCSN